jgi:uncharacterized membrane protein SpoIIM required for sporulation
MTESQFIEKNKAQWKRLEELLQTKGADADELSSLFVKVSSDLSYAKTNYPRRSVSQYLNGLVNEVFESIKVKKKENIFKAILNFYSNTLPSIIIKNKNAFITAFLVFALAFSIGFFSTIKDKNFPTQILGAEYVEMTESNIEKGDPMAVYKDKSKNEMFLGITSNNIKVAFFTYVSGILFAFGSIFVLLKNGIMVGAFQGFFYIKSLFITSFLTIWIHGTIEIFSIIIAGAAGIVLGLSILQPGTYKRSENLRIGAVESISILMSTIPLFVIAGMFESYLTRHTDLADYIKWMVILLSLTFMLGIYVIYPAIFYYSGKYVSKTIEINTDIIDQNNLLDNTSKSDLQKSLTFVRMHLRKIIVYCILPLFSILSITYFFLLYNYMDGEGFIEFGLFVPTFDATIGGYMLLIISIFVLMYYISFLNALISEGTKLTYLQFLSYLKSNAVSKLVICTIYCSVVYFLPAEYSYYALLVFPMQIVVIVSEKTSSENSRITAFISSIKMGFKFWPKFIISSLFLIFIFFITSKILESQLISMILEFVKWHYVSENTVIEQNLISKLMLVLVVLFILPIFYTLFRLIYIGQLNEYYSPDLAEQLETFGKKDHLKYEGK